MTKNSYWQNLALAALGMFYVMQFVFPVVQNNVLSGLGSDYRAFWAAGYIANHWNYAEIYNLDTLSRVQRPLTPDDKLLNQPFSPVPAPYLPFFLLPFQLFALLPALVSFWVWELVNFLFFIGYVVFFIRRLDPGRDVKKLVLVSLLFAPVMTNFWWGQPGVFLMICSGEFFWNLHKGNYIRAGIWLSGWLFKPQLLVLILPALLVYRAWKPFISFAAASLVISLLSILLLGEAGIIRYLALLNLWGDASGTLPAINPYLMINWRMLGIHVGDFTTPIIGWLVIGAGSLWTLWLAFRKAFLRFKFSSIPFLKWLFGLFSATCIVTWHSHQHSLIILVPLFLAWAVLEEKQLARLMPVWLYAMPLSVVLTFFVAILMRFQIFPVVDAIGGLIEGSAGLFAGLFFVQAANSSISENGPGIL